MAAHFQTSPSSRLAAPLLLSQEAGKDSAKRMEKERKGMSYLEAEKLDILGSVFFSPACVVAPDKAWGLRFFSGRVQTSFMVLMREGHGVAIYKMNLVFIWVI